MAGAGYKLFQTGDVLTAAQVNTYLNEQTVMVFASAAARTTALTSVLAEGMVSYLQDTDNIEVYNGSAWVGFTGDITEVQAGTGISVASGTGPIPVVTNTMATAIDAKGDLVVGTGADTFSRLAVGGTNGHTLQVDSSTSTGLKWAAAASGGMTLLSTTTLSGATTTISGISGSYKDLRILVYAATNSTADGNFTIKFNGLSDSQYITQQESGTFTNRTNSFYSSASTVSRTNANNTWDITIGNYASTTAAMKSVNGAFVYIEGATQPRGDISGGWFSSGAAITSLTFANTGGNFSAGTVELYGVN